MFVVNYCDRDKRLAKRSVAALQRLYPEHGILSIPDDPPLKQPQFGGQWTERWMKAALEYDWDVVVKIDPDTRAIKAVTYFPGETDVFGWRAPAGTYYPGDTGVMCGAAIGFTRSAVERILSSGFLLDEKYTRRPYASEMGTPARSVSLQDAITEDVVERIGLARSDWPGLDIRFSWDEQRFFSKDATFIHPCLV